MVSNKRKKNLLDHQDIRKGEKYPCQEFVGRYLTADKVNEITACVNQNQYIKGFKKILTLSKGVKNDLLKLKIKEFEKGINLEAENYLISKLGVSDTEHISIIFSDKARDLLSKYFKPSHSLEKEFDELLRLNIEVILSMQQINAQEENGFFDDLERLKLKAKECAAKCLQR